MNKMIMMVVVVFMMSGCALDSENQEEHKAKTSAYPYNQTGKEKIEVTEYVYIDADGNIIEDPIIIAELDIIRDQNDKLSCLECMLCDVFLEHEEVFVCGECVLCEDHQ